uniref:sunset domain-containing protein n=1 Tax=Saccharothrix mutabilis TaxID=33921 RepID=UPI0031DCECB5
MSSLFGQVWLWSLLSFVAGVALTWLVLVRPAKREMQDLEERLLGASPRPVAPVVTAPPAPAEPARDEFDDWHRSSSSPVEDLLRDDDPPRYDVAGMKLDERDRMLEELDDEHRPLSDFEEQHDFPEYEDDRPRSLFERLSPGGEPVTTSSAAESDEPPALPVEQTHLLPPARPAAEVAVPRQPEPTAPPEVEAFQPREVWREEPEPVVYGEDEDPAEGPEQEDEPERPAERTTLIPATALARAIAEVDARPDEPSPDESRADESRADESRAEESRFEDPRFEEPPADQPRFEEPIPAEPRFEEPRQAWPDRDLTGEYPVIRAELPTPPPAPARPDLPEPDRAEPEPAAPGLFTPDATTILDARDIAAHTPEPSAAHHDEAHALPGSLGGPATAPEPAESPASADEPFVPRFQPEPPADTRPEPPAEARSESQPEVRPEPKPEPKEPARPRSLFEPILTPDDEFVDEPPAPPKPKPAAPGNDQPFVPKLAPELLESEGNGGLPQRPVRPAGSRTTPPPPPPAPAQPISPPPPRPVRPRPVGFSPSTGGRPASTTTRYQQPEGFNPRSPFGPGSVLPKSDGMAPAPDFQVKATLTGRRYFTAESANFSETRADVWFRTISDAEKAGFRPAP